MTEKRDPSTRDWKTQTLRLNPELHQALKMLARRDRRSTQNLINLILERWVQNKRYDEFYENSIQEKGGNER